MEYLTHDYTTTPHVLNAELWMENSSDALASGDLKSMAAQVSHAGAWSTVYNSEDKKRFNTLLDRMARRLVEAGMTDTLDPKWVKRLSKG